MQQLLGRPNLLRHAQPDLIDQLQGRRPINQRPLRPWHMPSGTERHLELVHLLGEIHVHRCQLHSRVLSQPASANWQEHTSVRDGLVSRL